MSQDEVTVLVPDPPTQPPTPDQGLDLPDKSASLSDPNPSNKPSGCIDITIYVFMFTIFILFCIVFIPLYLLYAGVAWLICNINVTEDEPKRLNSVPGNKHFYQKAQDLKEAAGRVAKRIQAIRSRLVIFMLTWLIVNLAVPKLRNSFVLETKLWKWTLLVTMISCGYYPIAMFTRCLVDLLCSNVRFKKKNSWVYFVKGLKRSVNLVVLSGSILLTWVLYFRTSHGIKKTKDTDTMLHVGTWSFVTLTIAAVLWVLKSVLLLKWEADAVYGRFSARIMNAGFQVYFLRHMFRRKDKKDDQVNHVITDESELLQPEETAAGKDNHVAKIPATGSSDDQEEKEEEMKKEEGILRNDKNANLYTIKKMAEYFVDLSRASSREDDGSSDVLKQCQEIKPAYTSDGNITVEELTKIYDLEKEDAQFLYSKLKDDPNSDQISYNNFEKFMVNAQKHCVALGHTLMDAQKVVKVLNNVMTALLIAIVFIAWLLLTDIATTKILVLIASPLLAATFVFADTCKKVFEGIIFAFINHPFDVGDRCIIHETELEVKRMSVLTTTFIVIGTKKETLYPNSALAPIPIINLRGDPDPSDHIELTLDSKWTKSMLDELQTNINKVFLGDRGKKYETKNTILIKEIGHSVKMEIRYKNVMSIHETTHSQCLMKKKLQKSELLLQIKQFIEKINKETRSTATISQELS